MSTNAQPTIYEGYTLNPPAKCEDNTSRYHVTSGVIYDRMNLKDVVSMPTILKSRPYRLFFYAGDRNEPPHVHVERDDDLAKFWLSPVRLGSSRGFNRSEIVRIQGLVEENQELLLRSWDEYLND